MIPGDQGNTLIELAFVLPVFFTIVVGFIYFALFLLGYANITYGSRQAMRYACLHSIANAQPTSLTNVNAIIQPLILSYPANISSTALTYSSGNIVGSTATVTVTLNYQAGLSFHATASGTVTQ